MEEAVEEVKEEVKGGDAAEQLLYCGVCESKLPVTYFSEYQRKKSRASERSCRPCVHAQHRDIRKAEEAELAGAEPPSPFEAAQTGSLAGLNEYIRSGQSHLSKNPMTGRTVLQEATVAENLLAMEFLLENGVSPNHKSIGVKETALHYAANQGFLEGMRMLVAYNADVSAVNKIGSTPLHYASTVDAARALCLAGAQESVRNKKGVTPEYCAREREQLEVVAFLQKRRGQRMLAMQEALRKQQLLRAKQDRDLEKERAKTMALRQKKMAEARLEEERVKYLRWMQKVKGIDSKTQILSRTAKKNKTTTQISASTAAAAASPLRTQPLPPVKRPIRVPDGRGGFTIQLSPLR